MKVCQILYSGLGGHGSVALSFTESDIEKQFEHNYIFFGIEPALCNYKDFCMSNGYKFKAVQKKKGLDLNSLIKVYKYLRQLKPNVILLHSTSLIYLLVLYKIFNKATVIQIEHQQPLLKRKSEWLWTKLGMRFADKMVFLTKDYIAKTKERLGSDFKSDKVAYIPNGINLSTFYPTLSNLNSSPILVSMISRFTEIKDHQTLLKAIVQLNADGHKIDLALAGTGETLELLRKNFNHPFIKFVGLLNEDEIVRLLQKSDIYVHASFGETMSTSIMQALAMGKYVIGSNVAGIHNMIDDKVTGFLYESKNIAELANTILHIINHKPEDVAKNAVQYAKNNFSSINMFNAYVKLF